MRIISGIARGTKLYTLEGTNTRPTLDRVKEALFSAIQQKIIDACVLDLFAGSGALALESISRGAKKAYLCDHSKQAINVIKMNIEKMHAKEKTEVLQMDYKQALTNVAGKKFDIIFLDPPYETNYVEEALRIIIKQDIINEQGIVIVETDNEKKLEEINKMEIDIIKIKKYGRVILAFLNRKG